MGAGVDTGAVEAGVVVTAGSVVSGDSVVVVVTDSVLDAVVTGGSLVIVVELGVVGSGGTVLVAVSSPFPHADAAASNPSTRPTRRMRMTPSFSFLFHGRAEHARRARVERQGPTVGIAKPGSNWARFWRVPESPGG